MLMAVIRQGGPPPRWPVNTTWSSRHLSQSAGFSTTATSW